MIALMCDTPAALNPSRSVSSSVLAAIVGLCQRKGHYTLVGNSIRPFNGGWLARIYRFQQGDVPKSVYSLTKARLGGGISGSCAVSKLIRDRWTPSV